MAARRKKGKMVKHCLHEELVSDEVNDQKSITGWAQALLTGVKNAGLKHY